MMRNKEQSLLLAEPGYRTSRLAYTMLTRQDIPQAIWEKMQNSIPLQVEEIQTIVKIEAADIGLTFEEAIRLWRNKKLPNSVIGTDIGMLLDLIAS